MSDVQILFRVGCAIREYRELRKFSQEKLAEIASVDRSFLGRVERGEMNVSIITLCEIAQALGITLKDIIDLAYEKK